jgi:cytochrome c oxidase cbb3-type subunit IV
MKFINYLEGITGIGIYPLTSFVIFFVFFMAVTAYTFRRKKNRFDHVSRIPLDLD